MEWRSIYNELPKEEGYYDVKYFDGEEDSKPFRIRPRKNIYGFYDFQNGYSLERKYRYTRF